MARRFRGEFTQKVDGKGRVSIPSQFRRVLEQGDPGWSEGKTPEFVIVYGDDSFEWFECYSVEGIDQVDDMIDALPRDSEEREYLEEIYNGFAQATGIDDTGRIVLTSKLRKKLDIGEEAYFIGKGDHFQVWRPDTYDRVEGARKRAWRESRPEGFKARSLLRAPSKGD